MYLLRNVSYSSCHSSYPSHHTPYPSRHTPYSSHHNLLPLPPHPYPSRHTPYSSRHTPYPSHHTPTPPVSPPTPPTSWFPKVLNLFTDKKLMGDLPAQKEMGFFNSACTLLGNLLRGLLTRSIDVFVCQITKGGTPSLPLFQVELCLRAGGLVFEPSLEEVEESVVFVLGQITKTMQNVPHLKVHVCIYACTYICMYIRIYVCIYVRMFVCMYLHTYVCMYVCK